MNDYGPLHLDEHAAFWARDDELDGGANGRFEFDIDGEEFAMLMRQALFARTDFHMNDRAHYFHEVCGSGAIVVAHTSLAPSTSIHTKDYLQGRSAFRPFRPRDAARYGIATYSDGTARWFYRTQDKKGNLGFLSQSPFRFIPEPTAAEFLQLPQAEFLALCARQWNAPDSEMRCAYEFDQLPLAQRDAQVLGCENGEPEELRRLMLLLAHLIWSEAAKMDYEFEVGQQNEIWLNLHWDELFESGEGENADHLSRIHQAWRDAILWTLRPRYIGRAMPLHIEYWLHQGRESLRAVVDCPTHHEQLEAHLQLREWARRSLAPAEQRELFDLSA